MVVLNSEMFCEGRLHGLVGGKPIFREFSIDICEFIRWQLTHSTKKKKQYDNKKYLYYYHWEYKDMKEWFEKEGKTFHYPEFLNDNNSTISIKLSVGRMVKGRRNMHDTNNLIKNNGNMIASHCSNKLDGESTSREHKLFINAYYSAKTHNIGVLQYIKSDYFIEDMCGTISHELTHAYDSYHTTKKGMIAKDKRICIYKKYRKANGIGKEYIIMNVYGEWNGDKFNMDVDFIERDKNLQAFFYILIYYTSNSEMHAYLQTFYNQLCKAHSKNGYDSWIYRRYHVMKYILDKYSRNVPKELAGKTINDSFINDFTKIYPKIKRYVCDDKVETLKGFAKFFLDTIDKYIYKMNKLLYDVKNE